MKREEVMKLVESAIYKGGLNYKQKSAVRKAVRAVAQFALSNPDEVDDLAKEASFVELKDGEPVSLQPQKEEEFNWDEFLDKAGMKKFTPEAIHELVTKLGGSDWDIDNFAPVKAYVVYWDIDREVVSQVTMYAETLYPISLTRAVKVFKPERAVGANVIYEMITGDTTEPVVCVF